ncbi:MAG: molybdopterin cofactor-binding domain-containing protein [Hymenobacter sp.]
MGLLRRAGLAELTADGRAAPSDEKPTHSAYSFGAVFAEVRVDSDLGTVRVARLVGAYDIGRVVNPRLAHSQCIGGMMMGIGMALLEKPTGTRALVGSPMLTWPTTIVPVCADVPALDALFVPGADPVLNPLGTKGVAELGLCGVAPAIANAVWHATGQAGARAAHYPRQAAGLGGRKCRVN